MPVKNKKSRRTGFDYAVMILVAAFVFCFMLDQKSGLGNALLFGGLSGVIVWIILGIMQRHTDCNSCTVFTRATVKAIVPHIKDNSVTLQLQYSVLGQPVEGKVLYHESRCPEIGDTLGIYYNELHPTLCMLKMYKEHVPRWTDITRKEYRNGVLALLILGGLFAGIGGALLIMRGNFLLNSDLRAEGYVSGYIEQQNTGVNRTIEYSPVVTYEYDGQTYVANTPHSQWTKSYEIGDHVTVRFSEEQLTFVVIEGDDGDLALAGLMTIVGIAALLTALVRWGQRKKVYADIDSCNDQVPFM